MFDAYNQEYETVELEEKVEYCDSVEELKNEILPLLLEQKKQWEKKILGLYLLQKIMIVIIVIIIVI